MVTTRSKRKPAPSTRAEAPVTDIPSTPSPALDITSTWSRLECIFGEAESASLPVVESLIHYCRELCGQDKCWCNEQVVSSMLGFLKRFGAITMPGVVPAIQAYLGRQIFDEVSMIRLVGICVDACSDEVGRLLDFILETDGGAWGKLVVTAVCREGSGVSAKKSAKFALHAVLNGCPVADVVEACLGRVEVVSETLKILQTENSTPAFLLVDRLVRGWVGGPSPLLGQLGQVLAEFAQGFPEDGRFLPCEVFQGPGNRALRSSCGDPSCEGAVIGGTCVSEFEMEKLELFLCEDCGFVFSSTCGFCGSCPVPGCCWGCAYRRMAGGGTDARQIGTLLVLRHSGEKEAKLLRSLLDSQTETCPVANDTICPSGEFLAELRRKIFFASHARATVLWLVRGLLRSLPVASRALEAMVAKAPYLGPVLLPVLPRLLLRARGKCAVSAILGVVDAVTQDTAIGLDRDQMALVFSRLLECLWSCDSWTVGSVKSVLRLLVRTGKTFSADMYVWPVFDALTLSLRPDKSELFRFWASGLLAEWIKLRHWKQVESFVLEVRESAVFDMAGLITPANLVQYFYAPDLTPDFSFMESLGPGAVATLVPELVDQLVKAEDGNVTVFPLLKLLELNVRAQAEPSRELFSCLLRIISHGNSGILQAAVHVLVAVAEETDSAGVVHQLIRSGLDTVACSSGIDSVVVRCMWVLASVIEAERTIVDNAKAAEIVHAVLGRFGAIEPEKQVQLIAMLGQNSKVRELVLDLHTALLLDTNVCIGRRVMAVEAILKSARGDEEPMMTTTTQRPGQIVHCRGLAGILDQVSEAMFQCPVPDTTNACVRIIGLLSSLGIVNPRLLPPLLLARFILGQETNDTHMLSYAGFAELLTKDSLRNMIPHMISSAVGVVRKQYGESTQREGILNEAFRMSSVLFGGLLFTKTESKQVLFRLVHELRQCLEEDLELACPLVLLLCLCIVDGCCEVVANEVFIEKELGIDGGSDVMVLLATELRDKSTQTKFRSQGRWAFLQSLMARFRGDEERENKRPLDENEPPKQMAKKPRRKPPPRRKPKEFSSDENTYGETSDELPEDD